MPRLTLIAVLGAALLYAGQRVQLRVDDAQARAVLAIVHARRAGESVDSAAWARLFSSEPYRRLAQREASLRRPFTEEAFREFVVGGDLASRADHLRRTLESWRSRDLQPSARRVLAYLPAEARIRATVYPVIKPQSNSFVFDVRGDPAIFLYVDPAQSAEAFENTVAHELHHIGFASVRSSADSLLAGLPERSRTAAEWMGAFGEGFAMLAAAGGPDLHPHASSPPEERARWDRDIANFATDLRELETFFLDIVDGRLTSDADVNARGYGFFGVQGPWYTVGYRMAVIVEERFGRDVLIECMLDPRRILARYNEAVAAFGDAASLPRWSPRLLRAIGVG
ncbi:MAG TPA: DUF5700 domain-containing putative Zn-dependent protease [Gemmatimonadaceae bacterium]|nr:DUF5700 domain-containing putative Zn-dependent protease [Gemmatimonadaceae bacterium]